MDGSSALNGGVNAAAAAGGAVLMGVADLTISSPPGYDAFSRAVVSAAPLSRGVLATCRAEPTHIYRYHYRTVNALLDNVAARVAAFLEGEGYATLAVPASQIEDWENLSGALSHIRLGVLAGLGFIGKNNLLVTRRFGAGVRLVSVLTDAPLVPNVPVAGDCAVCVACVRACPAGALSESGVAWSRDLCLAKLTDFKKRITNQYICGVCVRACAERAATR